MPVKDCSTTMTSPLVDNLFPVIENLQLTEDIVLLKLLIPEIAKSALPGQFVMMKVRQESYPLLRRPFSILTTDPVQGTVDILLRTVGRGTKLLGTAMPAKKLTVLGPLGNPFPLEGDYWHALLVAGGIGLPPVYFAIEPLRKMGKRITLYYGAKTETEHKILSGLNVHSVSLRQSTDDGTLGYHGYISELLREDVKAGGSKAMKGMRLFGCGPATMMHSAAMICEDLAIESFFSVETAMACGIGLCQGCVVPVSTTHSHGFEYKLACKDGPIFPGAVLAQEDYGRSLV